MRESDGKRDKTRLTYNLLEAGRLLGLGRNATYAAARAQEIPTLRIGRRLLVSKRSLDRLLDEDGEPPR